MNTRHDDDYNFVFKIILLGDTNVGKTHLLSRYIKGQLPKQKGPTIGVEFATKPVPLKTGGTVRDQIWDTGKLLLIDFLSRARAIQGNHIGALPEEPRGLTCLRYYQGADVQEHRKMDQRGEGPCGAGDCANASR